MRVWWEENIEPINCGDLCGVTYSSFWREWRRRYPKIDLSFYKTHPPGERGEIDFKGRDAELGYLDRRTGEFVVCRLFGSILCFSQKFYVEATHSEKQPDLLNSTANSFTYFGGVPHTLVFDNAKTATTQAHRYDPDLNKEYVRFCEHYGTAPVQARPRKPKDKNLIECTLGVFWRWAKPKLNERTFYSLEEINRFLKDLLATFNQRIQRKYGLSRDQKFIEAEREKLYNLPERSFEYAKWKSAKLHQDCHLQINYNFYSAPYTLRGKSLDVRITSSFIEIFHHLERVALHKKQPESQRGRYVSQSSHLPEAHKAILEATPQNIIKSAVSIGPETHRFISNLINKSIHPLRYLRRAQAITTRMKNRYGCEKVEHVCGFLNKMNAGFTSLKEIEKLAQTKGLNTLGETNTIKPITRKSNPNLRGHAYWTNQ